MYRKKDIETLYKDIQKQGHIETKAYRRDIEAKTCRIKE